jgi:hypothetical protein
MYPQFHRVVRLEILDNSDCGSAAAAAAAEVLSRLLTSSARVLQLFRQCFESCDHCRRLLMTLSTFQEVIGKWTPSDCLDDCG